MQSTIIGTFILLIISFSYFKNWEIPINLNFDLLEVVGGYPTLIDSLYCDFFNISDHSEIKFEIKKLPEPILVPRIQSQLNWSCIIESNDECISVLTSSKCLNSSQFSISYWMKNLENVQCIHKTSKDCDIPIQKGNVCENVVTSIQKIDDRYIIHMENFEINSQIHQIHKKLQSTPNFQNSSKVLNNCQNYTIRDTIRMLVLNETVNIGVFEFGINSSKINPKESTSFFLRNVMLCNCLNNPDCSIPILSSSPNSSSQFNSMKLEIFHTHGYIYSAVLTFSGEEDQSYVKNSILFYDPVQGEPKTRYELSRGRFHCPSETSCISEILYPLTFLNSFDEYYLYLLLIICFLVSLSLLN